MAQAPESQETSTNVGQSEPAKVSLEVNSSVQQTSKAAKEDIAEMDAAAEIMNKVESKSEHGSQERQPSTES